MSVFQRIDSHRTYPHPLFQFSRVQTQNSTSVSSMFTIGIHNEVTRLEFCTKKILTTIINSNNKNRRLRDRTTQENFIAKRMKLKINLCNCGVHCILGIKRAFTVFFLSLSSLWLTTEYTNPSGKCCIVSQSISCTERRMLRVGC